MREGVVNALPGVGLIEVAGGAQRQVMVEVSMRRQYGGGRVVLLLAGAVPTGVVGPLTHHVGRGVRCFAAGPEVVGRHRSEERRVGKESRCLWLLLLQIIQHLLYRHITLTRQRYMLIF